jgi:hypothetical protein
MPTHKEFYDAVSNISVKADTLNLNTDNVESKLDTVSGILTTTAADISNIRNSNIIANGSGEVQVEVVNNVNVRGYDNANGDWYSLPLCDGATSVPVSYDPSQGSVFPVTQQLGYNSTHISFTSTTATQLFPVNSSRKSFSVYCEVGTLYVLLNNYLNGSSTQYTFRMSAGDFYENNTYYGRVMGLFASSGSKAYFTEIY